MAASNHPELLDRAVWRRFQVHLELPAPGVEEIRLWLRRFQGRTSLGVIDSVDCPAEQLVGLSFAEVEEFGLSLARRAVLKQADGDRVKAGFGCVPDARASAMGDPGGAVVGQGLLDWDGG